MLVLLIFVAVVCGFIGYAIGQNRGRATAGFWLGLLLGPVGCLAALFLPKE